MATGPARVHARRPRQRCSVSAMAAASSSTTAAIDLAAVPPGKAGIAQLRAFLTQADAPADAESVKLKEQAVNQLAELLVKEQDAQGLAELLSQLRGFFAAIPKAKTAKIVRHIIDSISKVPGSTQLQARAARWLGEEHHAGAHSISIFLSCAFMRSTASRRATRAPPWTTTAWDDDARAVVCVLLSLAARRCKCARSRSSGHGQRSAPSCGSASS